MTKSTRKGAFLMYEYGFLLNGVKVKPDFTAGFDREYDLLVRTALYRSERGIFQNPLFQPHNFFSSRRKENVPLTVQKIGAAAPCIAQPPLAAALSAE